MRRTGRSALAALRRRTVASQAVHADLHCDYPLPCDFCIAGVDLACRDVARQGVGHLETNQRRRVKSLVRLFPGAEPVFNGGRALSSSARATATFESRTTAKGRAAAPRAAHLPLQWEAAEGIRTIDLLHGIGRSPRPAGGEIWPLAGISSRRGRRPRSANTHGYAPICSDLGTSAHKCLGSRRPV